MVCMRVAFHQNDRNHEDDETTNTTQAAKKRSRGLDLWNITETTEMTNITKIRGVNHGFPQTTGLEIPDFWLLAVRRCETNSLHACWC